MNEKNFNLRFSLAARITAEFLENDDFDENEWLGEWEGVIKPRLIRAVFAELRALPGWEARIRNRGISPEDEVEIVVTREYESETDKQR